MRSVCLILRAYIRKTRPVENTSAGQLAVEPLESRQMMASGFGFSGTDALEHQSHDACEHTSDSGKVAGAVDKTLMSITGDANGDHRFDQLDIVQVARAGKFESGDPATWEEGDWNHDGVFDESDLIAALTADRYLANPPSSTLHLHSNPDATKVIFLDFDGHNTVGTIFNLAYTDGQETVTPAFDMDGDLSTFSLAEEERIKAIWERVAEDFIPFDVDVTTEDPGLDALVWSGRGDDRFGIRVVIGDDDGHWLGGRHGGFSFQSFGWTTDTPAFVFKGAGLPHEKATAEIISHEVGHTLQLKHDATTTTQSEYYFGHGDGRTGWAPIMGSGNIRELTQWSDGSYLGATNIEDDIAVMMRRGKFGYREDDHGNSFENATRLNANGRVLAHGIVEQRTDVDYFTFATSGGEALLEISPAARGPNLDILASLYNSNGELILTSNPLDELDASFQLGLEPGAYFVSVEGTGKPAMDNGVANQPLGYSDYGSLGFYTISGRLATQLSPVTPTSCIAGSIIE